MEESSEVDRVPIAVPHPLALWPIDGSTNRSVAEAGPYAFGSSRDNGARRSIGVQIGAPRSARAVSPLDGKVMGAVRWSRDRDGPLFALFLRTHRYVFGFGCMIPESLPLDEMCVLNNDLRQGNFLGDYRHSLHLSMFEPAEGVTDSDFMSGVGRRGLVWRVGGPVPAGLRNPTRFLEVAGRDKAGGG